MPNRTLEGVLSDGIVAGYGTTGTRLIANVAAGSMDGHAYNGGNDVNLEAKGNYFGVGLDGYTVAANVRGNVRTAGNAQVFGGTTAADRNIFAGYSDGLRVDSGTGTVIAGNYFGVGADGKTPIGAMGTAINTGYSAHNLTIGGTSSGSGNVMRSSWHALIIETVDGCSDIRVIGNYIGMAMDGTSLYGANEKGGGVYVRYCSGAQIGGSGVGEGNYIGNAWEAVQIRDNADNTVIQGNYMGVTPNGEAASIDRAVTIHQGTGARVGGVNTGEANTIRNVTDRAVVVVNNATGNTIRGNSIASSSVQAIDLSNNGITANDDNDVDTGPNGLQNYPVVYYMKTCDGTTQGPKQVFNSTPSTTFTIDYYANPSWVSGQPLQAEQWLSYQTVTTDANGDASFTYPSGANVTMTATAPDGSTSELGGRIDISFNECQDMIPRVVADTTLGFFISAEWTAVNLPQTSYKRVAKWNGTELVYTPEKVGLDVSLSVGGVSLPFNDQTVGEGSGVYELNGGGWYAMGRTPTPLPEGTYDIVLTVTDPVMGFTMTKTYTDAFVVAAPKVAYTTTFTNNQTPTLHGSAANVGDIHTAYILPAGATLDVATSTPRALIWKQDYDTNGAILQSGSWQIVTSKSEFAAYLTAENEREKSKLVHNFAVNNFYFVEGVDVDTIHTLAELQATCTIPEMQQRMTDMFGAPLSEQGCRDTMQVVYDAEIARMDQDLQDRIAALDAPGSAYDFTPLPEGTYDVYVVGNDVDYVEFTKSFVNGLVVDLTKPNATMTTESGSVSPALMGAVDEPGATVTVTIEGKTYTAVNNGDGTWVLGAGIIGPLAPGNYTVTITVTDLAGNTTTTTKVLGIFAAAEAGQQSQPTLSQTGVSMLDIVMTAFGVLSGAALMARRALPRRIRLGSR